MITAKPMKKKKVAQFTGHGALDEVDDIGDLGVESVKKYLETEGLIPSDTRGW